MCEVRTGYNNLDTEVSDQASKIKHGIRFSDQQVGAFLTSIMDQEQQTLNIEYNQ